MPQIDPSYSGENMTDTERMEPSDANDGHSSTIETGVVETNNHNQFRASEIELLVGEVLSERLGEIRYEPSKCKELSQELAAHIMERIKEMSIKKYKMVAIVSIGSQKGVPGMQFGSRCLWNKETDQFASVKFTNGSLFAVAMVYGLCFE